MNHKTQVLLLSAATLIGVEIGFLVSYRGATRNSSAWASTRAPTVAQAMSSVAKFGRAVPLNPDDVAVTHDLDERQSRGEFILQNERPLMRRSQERHFASIAANALAANAVEYNRVFADLGIDTEISRQLQSHLAKIERASVEAESAIRQLLDARLQVRSKGPSTTNLDRLCAVPGIRRVKAREARHQ